jgi:hypothetical protein
LQADRLALQVAFSALALGWAEMARNLEQVVVARRKIDSYSG